MIEDLNLNNIRQALPDLPGESDLSNQYPYRNNEGFMLVVDIGLYEIAFTIVNNYHQVIYFDTQPTTKPEIIKKTIIQVITIRSFLCFISCGKLFL